MISQSIISRIIEFFSLSAAFEDDMIRAYREFHDTAPSLINEFGHNQNRPSLLADGNIDPANLLDSLRELIDDLRSENHNDCSVDHCDYIDEDEKEEYVLLERERGLFLNWLIFDFKLKNGKTPIAYFVDKNPYEADSATVDLYQQLLNSHFGIFEIIAIER